jgi:NADP-dependent 3-hydroxy acid dehydrogenase YdfG
MLDLNLPNAVCKSVDITDAAAVRKAIHEIDLEYYAIDCLINNAGAVLAGHFSETALEAEGSLVDVNIKGVLNCTKAVAPLMQANQQGTIINVSSIVDRIFSTDKVAVYSATKAAIGQLTQSLHATYRHDNIRCCNVAPGDVDTAIWDGQAAEAFRDPAAKPLTAEDIANTILWIYQRPQELCIRDIVVTHISCPI